MTTPRAFLRRCRWTAAALLCPTLAIASPAPRGHGATTDTVTVTTTDGVRLRAWTVGGGADTLLVPLGAHLAVELAPLARGRTLLFYDPRSRGGSEPVRDTARLGMDRDVADLEAVRAHFGVSRAAVLGWSYFGAVAARYADAHPGRVTRLVQLAPVPPRAGPYPGAPAAAAPAPDASLAAEVERMRADGRAVRDPAGFCRAQARLEASTLIRSGIAPTAPRSDPCALPNEWPDSLARVMLPTLLRLGRYDWRPAVRARRTPTLVVMGTRDFNPIQAGEEWAAAPDARLLRVDAGHYPHVERAAVVLPAIDAFLRGRWPGAAAR